MSSRKSELSKFFTIVWVTGDFYCLFVFFIAEAQEKTFQKKGNW